MLQFLILANPRSRTAWLAEYLRCGHDLALGCHSVGEFTNRLRNTIGSVETSVALGWKLWRVLFPGVRFVIIHRTPFEIADSFARLSLVPDWMFLYQQDRALWACSENDPNTILYSFESLDRTTIRDELCSCVGVPFDAARDAELAQKNVQVDMAARRTMVEANRGNTIVFLDDMARGLARLEYGPVT